METQKNCWEAIQCGRSKECPAYPKFGRDCFAVTGTVCRGETQGSFEEKIGKCRACDFYKGLMDARF
ncbi:MAG: hypothetical protein HY913_24095 [Desulfomonile tiedjei]|nr:hypothetical protein [Desulfomonile tiedjei]